MLGVADTRMNKIRYTSQPKERMVEWIFLPRCYLIVKVIYVKGLCVTLEKMDFMGKPRRQTILQDSDGASPMVGLSRGVALLD